MLNTNSGCLKSQLFMLFDGEFLWGKASEKLGRSPGSGSLESRRSRRRWGRKTSETKGI
jgi:hypothetical protein